MYSIGQEEGLVASEVTGLELSLTWSVTLDDDIAAGIIRVAENGEDAEGAGVFGGCDVIAMTTHGYSGLERWLIGSVTERVIDGTKLPLLVVRPQHGTVEAPGKKKEKDDVPA